MSDLKALLSSNTCWLTLTFHHLVTLPKLMEVPWIVSWPSGILWSLRRHLTWIFFCSHIDENSWDARRRELNDRNKRCDEHKHSNFRCDLTCADQTALKDLSGLMMVTKSWWYGLRSARKKTRITQIKCLVRKKITSGAGLPASTLQENSAASPSFTTSFSGLTLITGLTGNIKAGYRKRPIVRMLVISICVTQESDAPPLWRQVEES